MTDSNGRPILFGEVPVDKEFDYRLTDTDPGILYKKVAPFTTKVMSATAFAVDPLDGNTMHQVASVSCGGERHNAVTTDLRWGNHSRWFADETIAWFGRIGTNF